jgi:hypothetical protein
LDKTRLADEIHQTRIAVPAVLLKRFTTRLVKTAAMGRQHPKNAWLLLDLAACAAERTMSLSMLMKAVGRKAAPYP